MRKLDKKVLKIISAQENKDYDADDISVALKCDDDQVQEALDSLKDQGLVEAVIHNGRISWKPAGADTFSISEADEPYREPKPAADKSSVDLLILEQPVQSFKPQYKFQRTPSQPQRPFSSPEIAKQRYQEQMYKPPTPTERPDERPNENKFADDRMKNLATSKIARLKSEPIEDDFDDDEFDTPQHGRGSAVTIAIAVIISIGVSALIAMIFINNATKKFNETIAVLENKMTESNAQLNQRIDELLLKIENLQKDIADQLPTEDPDLQAQVTTSSRRFVSKSMRSAVKPMSRKAASGRRSLYFKKRKTPADMIRETSESATMSEKNPSPPSKATSSSSYEPESSPAASDPGARESSSGETWEGASSAQDESER